MKPNGRGEVLHCTHQISKKLLGLGPGMPMITFHRRPCNHSPPPEAEIMQSYHPLRPKNAIISNGYPKFSGAFDAGKPLLTLIFAFHCSFQTRFPESHFHERFSQPFSKNTFRKFFNPIVPNFPFYCTFKKQFFRKTEKKMLKR